MQRQATQAPTGLPDKVPSGTAPRDYVLLALTAFLTRVQTDAGTHNLVVSAPVRQALQMLAEGKTLREISSLLDISYRTVRFHKVRIMEELGMSKNAELVKYALKHSIISAV